MIKNKIKIALTILLLTFLVGCESQPERTGKWDAPKDANMRVYNDQIQREIHRFENEMISQMYYVSKGEEEQAEKRKQRTTVFETMTEEEFITKAKEYLPLDIKEANTTVAEDGMKEIEYTSVEGNFLLTMAGIDAETKTIARGIISQSDTGTYTDSSGKIYEAKDVVEFIDTLSTSSYSSELNPIERSMDESIKYVNNLLPENSSEISREFEDEVGVTSVIYESGDFEIEVRYMHGGTANNEYDLDKTYGIYVNLIELSN